MVKTWLADAPAWLEVRTSPESFPRDPALDALDAGEREAIQLASELGADLLLMTAKGAPSLSAATCRSPVL